MKKASRVRIFIDYLMITFGSFLLALGVAVFMIDADVVPGGVTGLSMALNYLTGVSVGKYLLILNIPLFIWGVLELGWTFGWRTLYGFVTNSIFTDLLRGDIVNVPWLRLQDSEIARYLLANDFFFVVLLGGIFMGVGLGVVFKFEGTTAGTEIVSAILKKRFGISPGVSMLFVDLCVILVAAVVIAFRGDAARPVLALVAYAVLSLYISTSIIDKIIYGFDYAKNVMIFSKKNEEISQFILEKLDRGVTALHARGVYKGEEKDVLMSVIGSKQARELVPWVKSIDPTAFMIFSNVHEVVGEGFRRREEVELKFLKQEKVLNQAQEEAQEAVNEAYFAAVEVERARQLMEEQQAKIIAVKNERPKGVNLNTLEALAEQTSNYAKEREEIAKLKQRDAEMKINTYEEMASQVSNIVTEEDISKLNQP